MQIRFRCDPALLGLLPPPVPAREALPDWLRTMPANAASDMHGGGSIRTVKQCPPFVDAMMHGFVMTLPCDVQVQGGRLSWDWNLPRPATATHPRAPMSFHAAAQVSGTPFMRPGQLVVKFNSFWTIRLEPGWSLFVTHPVNRDDLPFRLLTGLVDADAFHQVGILFPAVWLDPGFEGTLPRGMPVAHCIPVRRDALVLETGAFDAAEQQRYEDTARVLLEETGHYRQLSRAARSGDPGSAVQPPATVEAGAQAGRTEEQQPGPA